MDKIILLLLLVTFNTTLYASCEIEGLSDNDLTEVELQVVSTLCEDPNIVYSVSMSEDGSLQIIGGGEPPIRREGPTGIKTRKLEIPNIRQINPISVGTSTGW